MDNRRIGVLDSGIGGLTVVRELIKALPGERVVYFGDTLRVPYGGRPAAEVTEFSMQMVRFLAGKDVKAIVLACNTIAAVCGEQIRAAVDIPVFDVLKPGARAAARAAKTAVGILATQNTINSGIHERLIKAHSPGLEVFARACPLFVPIVEEGLAETEMAAAAARHYLAGFGDRIDALLLGCTHYPLLANALRAATKAELIDPAAATCAELGASLEPACDSGAGHEFYASGDADTFKARVTEVLGAGLEVPQAKLLTLQP